MCVAGEVRGVRGSACGLGAPPDNRGESRSVFCASRKGDEGTWVLDSILLWLMTVWTSRLQTAKAKLAELSAKVLVYDITR